MASTQSIMLRVPATWREFAGFIRRPALASPVGLRAGWKTALAMLGLNLLGLAVLLFVLPLWQLLTGIKGPNAFEGIPLQYLIPAVVLAAPLVEECLFRGWLSGRPRALWLLFCCLGAVALLAVYPPTSATAGLAVLGALLLAPAGWVVLRKRAAPGWFAYSFAPIFFLGATIFALVHIFNYDQPGAAHLPMVLPQLWAGMTLGFVRTRVGLPASMLIHGASNAIALGLAGLSN